MLAGRGAGKSLAFVEVSEWCELNELTVAPYVGGGRHRVQPPLGIEMKPCTVAELAVRASHCFGSRLGRRCAHPVKWKMVEGVQVVSLALSVAPSPLAVPG